ncbi:MAG: hypothetical protein P8N43_16230, partial [Alphaproteobacteria bacterium]|nr:hypothetical protein [Alphaproteobacteria bacterium]
AEVDLAITALAELNVVGHYLNHGLCGRAELPFPFMCSKYVRKTLFLNLLTPSTTLSHPHK